MEQFDLSAPVSALFNKDTKMSAINMVDGTGQYGRSGDYAIGAQTNFQNADYRGYYWSFWEPYREYHHDHYHFLPQSDNFERAFKISRKLMEKKLVKPMKTVEDFFKLMDAIVEVIK